VGSTLLANICLQDREQGDRLKLADIQKLVDDDPSMHNLSDAKQKEYIDIHQDHRDVKTTGARSSNNAAAADCRECITKVSTEVCTLLNHIWVTLKLLKLRNLSERTGVCALAFFTRTHIYDSAIPSWVDSDDAVAFVSEVLNLDPMDFLTKFEQWACARTKGVYHTLRIVKPSIDKFLQLASAVQETLQSMRCDCTRLIVNGLRK
jgi:hypothetical protein